MSEPYIETLDGPRPLEELTEWSHVHATVAFEIGGVDLAAWATSNLEPTDARDVRSWLEELVGLRRALGESVGRQVFHSAGVDLAELLRRPVASIVSIQRDENDVVVLVDEHARAKTSYSRFAAAVDAFIESVRMAVAPLGEAGAVWWADTCDRNDDEWLRLPDDAFHDKRGAWLYGPNFEARIEAAAPDRVAASIEALPDYEERPSLFGFEGDPRRMLPVQQRERRVGFTCSPDTGTLSFPSTQVVRVCQLSEAAAGALWSRGPCPTLQARTFIQWLIEIVQSIAADCRVEHAVLVCEGEAPPTTPLQSGWIYAYAWAAVGEPTSDPRFNRVSLHRQA